MFMYFELIAPPNDLIVARYSKYVKAPTTSRQRDGNGMLRNDKDPQLNQS